MKEEYKVEADISKIDKIKLDERLNYLKE